jgi:DNA-binding response OmpR family regulator
MILDLGLPKPSGTDLLKRLRSSLKHIPILVLAAGDALSDRVWDRTRNYQAF